MQQQGHHASPIKNWKQLVVVVVFAFIVPIVVAVLISQYVTSGSKGMHEDESAIINRIQPVGEVVLAAPSGPKGQLTGEQVYAQVCKNCHEAGLAGAPKFGDKTAWAKVIAQGQPVAVDHALKGIGAMPAKGGNPDLEDVEVERAVAYMANKSGANWKEPPTIAPSGADKPIVAEATAPATAAPAAASATPAAGAAKPDGKKIFESTCVVCHGTGVAGAPKFGDKAAWAPRIKTGIDTLYQVALTGKGAMPPKGGNKDLPDADVKAAVDYMVAAAK